MGKILAVLALASLTAASAEEYAALSAVVTDVDGNPVQWATVTIADTDVHLVTLENGKTSPINLPPGQYTARCSAPGYVDNTIEDVLLVAGIQSTVKFILSRPPEDSVLIIRKPNIYLYPPETTEVTVRLELGEGCALTYTDPPYGDGWNVTIEPDGWMDNGIGYVVGEVDGEEVIFDAPRYSYLFYEADAPDVWQRGRGWLVTMDVLGDFFASTLREYGFVGREVDDFLEYWTPRLTESLFYAVYPQTEEIDAVVGLRVEPEPDSVLRLFFLIEPLDEAAATADWYLPEPEIQPFERQGFAVVEWGVCLADSLK